MCERGLIQDDSHPWVNLCHLLHKNSLFWLDIRILAMCGDNSYPGLTLASLLHLFPDHCTHLYDGLDWQTVPSLGVPDTCLLFISEI